MCTQEARSLHWCATCCSGPAALCSDRLREGALEQPPRTRVPGFDLAVFYFIKLWHTSCTSRRRVSDTGSWLGPLLQCQQAVSASASRCADAFPSLSTRAATVKLAGGSLPYVFDILIAPESGGLLLLHLYSLVCFVITSLFLKAESSVLGIWLCLSAVHELTFKCANFTACNYCSHLSLPTLLKRFFPCRVSFPKTSKTTNTGIELNHLRSCWPRKGGTRGTVRVQRTVSTALSPRPEK